VLVPVVAVGGVAMPVVDVVGVVAVDDGFVTAALTVGVGMFVVAYVGIMLAFIPVIVMGVVDVAVVEVVGMVAVVHGNVPAALTMGVRMLRVGVMGNVSHVRCSSVVALGTGRFRSPGSEPWVMASRAMWATCSSARE
jgi:hypothetical protein